jgi:hypothetical protein
MEMSRSNLNRISNLRKLSSSAKISWVLVKENLDFPWKWDYLLSNPNIDWNDILDIIAYLDNNGIIIEDPWYHISDNPNISPTIIFNNLGKPWDWYVISGNKFNHHEYFTSQYHKKNLVKRFLDICWDELIAKSCHYARIFNWNEGIYEDKNSDFYQLYLLECKKYQINKVKFL